MNTTTRMPGEIPEAYRSKTVEQALAHLAEELNEAATAAAKGLRFGIYSVNPELRAADQERNLVWLRREMKDVARAYVVLGDLVAGDDYARELANDLIVGAYER